MSDPQASLVDRLYEAGSPNDLQDWENRDGYYVAACRVSPTDVPALVELVRQWNDSDWEPEEDLAVDDEIAELLPVTAWRALADLKAETAVEPLVEILREVDGESDVWACEELPHVFGKIGPAAIEPLIRFATNEDHSEWTRSIAVRGLRCVVLYHPDTRERIVPLLTDMMSRADERCVNLNSTLLVELVEL